MADHYPPAPSVLTASVTSRITAATGLSPDAVLDGFVPDDLPADVNGYVLPYVVLYAGLGADLPAERDLSGLPDLTVSDWGCQTQCVGASAAIARDLAYDVKLALTGAPIGAGWLKPDDDFFAVAEPIADTQVSPARFYVPLRWRLTTT